MNWKWLVTGRLNRLGAFCLQREDGRLRINLPIPNLGAVPEDIVGATSIARGGHIPTFIRALVLLSFLCLK